MTTAGNVLIDAFSDSDDESTALPDTFFGPDDIDASNDTIRFEAHRLLDGDVVTYHDEGSADIVLRGGVVLEDTDFPSNIRQFAVMTVAGQPDLLKLGAVFYGDATSNQVDSSLDIIRFDYKHNFESGDPVVYDDSGNTDLVAGDNTKYVRVIDEYTISLHDSCADALLPVATFDTGDVDSGDDEIDFDSAHGFADGDSSPTSPRRRRPSPAPASTPSSRSSARSSGAARQHRRR